jgi:hypothetical protein
MPVERELRPLVGPSSIASVNRKNRRRTAIGRNAQADGLPFWNLLFGVTPQSIDLTEVPTATRFFRRGDLDDAWIVEAYLA